MKNPAGTLLAIGVASVGALTLLHVIRAREDFQSGQSFQIREYATADIEFFYVVTNLCGPAGDRRTKSFCWWSVDRNGKDDGRAHQEGFATDADADFAARTWADAHARTTP